jgi:TolA-binding protein
MDKLFDDKVIENIANMLVTVQKNEYNDLPALQSQLAAVEKNIDNMLNAIQNGVYNESTKGRLDELENRKKDLQISIMQEEISKNFITKEQIIFLLRRLRKVDITDYNQKQQLIDTFVNAIYIYDDRIVFTFNYKDGAKTVTLKDIERSDLSVVGVPLQTRR